MKLRMLCIECRPRYVDELLLVEQRDSGPYHVACPEGHRSVVSLQNFKFELLLDSSGMAILDGYTYEAVSSIAASFERFLEFYIEVMARKHGLSADELSRTWKHVKNKSERQIGSFLFVYLLENKCSPDFLEEEWFSFRNKVIHQGYIPSIEKVMAYGERIFKLIKGLLSELKATSQEAIGLRAMEMNRQARVVHHIPTMICHTYPLNEGPQSFKEGLAHLQEIRRRAYSV